jgi:hypothetical protein
MIEEKKIILVCKETGLPFVSALDDVHRQSSNLEAGLAWHGRNYSTEKLAFLKGSVPIYPRSNQSARRHKQINHQTLIKL